VTYAGRRYEGAQATYILEALGAKRHIGSVDNDPPFNPEQYVDFLAHEFMSCGLGFETWTRFTLDQVACYFRGRGAHWERVNERVQAVGANCQMNKAESPIRFTVPMG
jgi:hypothetical protein